jgi:hypothetical protein
MSVNGRDPILRQALLSENLPGEIPEIMIDISENKVLVPRIEHGTSLIRSWSALRLILTSYVGFRVSFSKFP